MDESKKDINLKYKNPDGSIGEPQVLTDLAKNNILLESVIRTLDKIVIDLAKSNKITNRGVKALWAFAILFGIALSIVIWGIIYGIKNNVLNNIVAVL